MPNRKKKIEAGEHDLHLFQEAIHLHEKLLEQEAQLKSRPIPEHVWSDFLKLPLDQRQTAIEQLASYTEILAAASKEGISLTEDKRLSWFAMKSLNLLPPSDLLELVSETDYTEIYNANGIQIFRNLEFYKMFSYTIAEMTLYTWEQLYQRDQKIKEQIIEQGFVKGFSGITAPYKLQIEEHAIAEARSSENRQFKVTFGYLAPLRDRSQKVTAVFATSKITDLNKKPSKKGA